MKEKTFEEALMNLREAADSIRDNNTTIEESLKQFEKGMNEYKYCNEILNEASQKIEIYEKEVDENER
ncbi:MAG: exodeoxyribonuclease VII small subunit [Peptostreptococcaceae bacterium]|nr:exodeoxyribonuclease VII small subunit [Peptostreptococcaceae bacterium]